MALVEAPHDLAEKLKPISRTVLGLIGHIRITETIKKQNKKT